MKTVFVQSAWDIASKIREILETYCENKYNYISVVCKNDVLKRFLPYFEDFDWAHIEYDDEYINEYIISFSKDKKLCIEKMLCKSQNVEDKVAAGDYYLHDDGATMFWVDGDCSSRILPCLHGMRVEFNLERP